MVDFEHVGCLGLPFETTFTGLRTPIYVCILSGRLIFVARDPAFTRIDIYLEAKCSRMPPVEELMRFYSRSPCAAVFGGALPDLELLTVLLDLQDFLATNEVSGNQWPFDHIEGVNWRI